MNLSLTHDEMNAYCAELHESNAIFKSDYPADSFERQPVHTVYGGANLFKAGFASKLGEVALKTLDTYAPSYSVFARALGLPRADTLPTNAHELNSLTRALEANPEQVRETKQAAWLAYTVYNRVVKNSRPSRSKTTALTLKMATEIVPTMKKMVMQCRRLTKLPKA